MYKARSTFERTMGERGGGGLEWGPVTPLSSSLLLAPGNDYCITSRILSIKVSC